MHIRDEVHTQIDDFETIRRQKALKIREAARLRGDTDFDTVAMLPKVNINAARIKKMGQIKVVTDTGNIVRLLPKFCKTGGDEASSSPSSRQNISHTGSWLDRRAFSQIDSYFGNDKGRSPRAVAKGDVSEGDRFFLKRCKDVLKKRHHTLQQAWQKLDVHPSEAVTLVEFVAATSVLFKGYEARLLYRLLDVKNNGNVTFKDLRSMLEAA